MRSSSRASQARYFQVRSAIRAGVCTLSGLALLSPAAAQTISPSQVTPPSLRAPPASNAVTLDIPSPSSTQSPVAADDRSVTLGDVAVGGDFFPELESRTEPFIAPLQGRRTSIAEIFAQAAAMERAYAAEGFVLVRVVVPAQRLVDGSTLRLLVVDGFLDSLEVNAVPSAVRAVVEARVAVLLGQRHLRLAQIERQLLIAGDLAGVTLTSTLTRGDQVGGSKLILQAVYSRESGSVGIDDRLSRELGPWQLMGTFALNSVFRLGEQLYVSGSLSDPARAFRHDVPVEVYGGGAVLPLGIDGLAVNPEYTHSATRTPAEPFSPASVGVFERIALRATYPVIRSREHTFNLSVSFEDIHQRVELSDFGALLNRDRYSVLRLGFTDDTYTAWGASLLSEVNISQGLGGRSPGDAIASQVPLSRQGASPSFLKASGSIRLGQPLPAQWRLNIVALGQTSRGTPLLRSEQFSLDGVDALSAFTPGTFSVDQGATVRGELGRVLYVSARSSSGSIAPYLFAAAGHGSLFDPTSAEQRTITAESLGIGTRATFKLPNGSKIASLGAELAHQYADVGGLRLGWRGELTAAVTF